MRRFPAPPSTPHAGLSTPQREDQRRSKVAPMQFEWQSPRIFPASSFARDSLTEDDGERARKRTHYEAMDVDTPPRSTPFSTEDCQPPTTPFQFSADPPPLPENMETTPFDTEQLLPPDAFSLAPEDPIPSTSALVSTTSHAQEGRRRRWGRRDKSPDRSTDSNQTTDDRRDGEEDEGIGQTGGVVGNRMRNGEFSFQVHHHHGASSEDRTAPLQPTLVSTGLDKNTPYVLLGYLHFASLFLLLLLCVSLLVLFLYTLKTDVQQRLSALTLELRSEILGCAKAYVDNNCDAATRIPMSEKSCLAWEACMERDVVVVGKARVVAEILAEVINGFVDVISIKTMLFVVISLVTTIYASSMALSFLPSRPPPPIQSPSLQYPPLFQHLGYHNPTFPPQGLPGYGYLPSPGPHDQGGSWGEGRSVGNVVAAQREGGREDGKKKGWFS